METIAQQRYMGWEDIKTALHYVHLSGRHVLEAARAARPALPTAHVEDRGCACSTLLGEAAVGTAFPYAVAPGDGQSPIPA